MRVLPTIRSLKRLLAKACRVQIRSNESLDSGKHLLLGPRFIWYLVLDVRTCEHSCSIHVAGCVRERGSHRAQHLAAVTVCLLNNHLQQLFLQPGQNREVFYKEYEFAPLPKQLLTYRIEQLRNGGIKAE